jgi:hypothetical protein
MEFAVHFATGSVLVVTVFVAGVAALEVVVCKHLAVAGARPERVHSRNMPGALVASAKKTEEVGKTDCHVPGRRFLAAPSRSLSTSFSVPLQLSRYAQ